MSSSSAQMLSFGKHKSRTFEDVYDNEPGYVDWCSQKAVPSGGMRGFLDFCASARSTAASTASSSASSSSEVRNSEAAAILKNLEKRMALPVF